MSPHRKCSNPLLVNYARAVRGLAWMVAFLVVISLSSHLALWWQGHGAYTSDYIPGTVTDAAVRQFSLDREHNLPSLFSTFLLGASSALFFVIAAIKRQSGDPYRIHWIFLGAGFLVMALDESLLFHEKMSRPLRELLAPDGGAGVLYFAWVVPGSLVAGVAAVAFFRFFRVVLGKSLRRRFLAAATLYLGGAIVAEMVGGYVAEASGTNDVLYALIVNLEETLEMTGLVVLISALASYIAVNHGSVEVILRNSGSVSTETEEPGGGGNLEASVRLRRDRGRAEAISFKPD